jgi:chemotaxis protein methyltransferase CheR
MESLIEIDRLTGSLYLLRDLISERLGLSLDDDRGIRLIINKLSIRVKHRQCKSFLEYYKLLMKDCPATNEEWRMIMAVLAKSKSSFWRQTEVMRNLVDVALPQLLSLSPATPLRIWSAGCATGEEPLAIAMALTEGDWFERAPIEIFASDSSCAAIESAMRGVYSEEKIRGLDVKLRDRYFTRKQNGWQVVPELQKLIQWRVANIMLHNEVSDLAQSHIIFCRNVFIYFTTHAICKTLQLFGRLMPAGAYLFSDGGEFFTSLVAQSSFFEPLTIGGSYVLDRRDDRLDLAPAGSIMSSERKK